MARVKPRSLVSDVLAVAGFGALTTAAWLLALPAGLAMLGASLLVLAFALGKDS